MSQNLYKIDKETQLFRCVSFFSS